MRAGARAFGIAVAATLAACPVRRAPAPDAPPALPRAPEVAPVPRPDAPRREFEAPSDARAPPLPPAPRPVSPERSPSGLAQPPVPELDAARRACVDRALARRGLDAWGDPAGTPAPRGAARGDARYALVLRRRPDVAAACSSPRPRP